MTLKPRSGGVRDILASSRNRGGRANAKPLDGQSFGLAGTIVMSWSFDSQGHSHNVYFQSLTRILSGATPANRENLPFSRDPVQTDAPIDYSLDCRSMRRVILPLARADQ